MSLLYRKHVPASMQSPSSASLAALLGVVGFDETELLQGGCLRPPPALYHYAGTITLYQYAVPLRRYHYAGTITLYHYAGAVPLRRAGAAARPGCPRVV